MVSLSELYALFAWPSSPLSIEGRRRMFEAMETLTKALEHEWLRGIVMRNRVRVVDVCSGGGIAGFAIAKLLSDKGVDVELALIDLRGEELDAARRYRDEYMPSVKLETYAMDAREIHKLGRSFDIALLWGFSMPHFSPWDALKLFASIALVLEPHGALLVEEVDRMLSIFMRVGYKYVWPEGFSDKPIISLHKGYDLLRGTVKRIFVDLSSGKAVPHEACLNWTLSFTAAFMWVFFEDVDLGYIARGSSRAILIAHRPRKAIDVDRFLRAEPSMLTHGDMSI